MKFIHLLKDSLHIFRTTKLIWVFGTISALISLQSNLFSEIRNSPPLSCLITLVTFVLSVVTFISQGSLVYTIYQAAQGRKVSLSEAWSKGKSKVFRVLVVTLLSFPLVIILIGVFLSIILIYVEFPSPSLYIFVRMFIFGMILIVLLFFTSNSVFGTCAVMINEIKTSPAVMASRLITLENIFHIVRINFVIYIPYILLMGLAVAILYPDTFQSILPGLLAFNYPSYLKFLSIPIVRWASCLSTIFLNPIFFTVMTLAYLRFIKNVNYPQLAKKEIETIQIVESASPNP